MTTEEIITAIKEAPEEDIFEIFSVLIKGPQTKETEPLVRSWEDSYAGGYYISNGEVENDNTPEKPTESARDVFRTRELAISIIAYAQLSHIVADANERSKEKSFWYVIPSAGQRLIVRSCLTGFLPMKTRDIAEECLKKHRKLWKQFYMIPSENSEE